jgi:alpha-D-ribose 1-methylphosphonate 5-triphosphate synthase subunit PhnH
MNDAPAPGLQDPVHDSQQIFRAALAALSRPACIQRLDAPPAGLPIGAAMAGLLLALADDETRVWWQEPAPRLLQWLRFHTGARSAAEASDATFAVVTRATEIPELQRFAWGSAASPEASCTLLIEVPSLSNGLPVQAHGPGIAGRAELRVAGLPEGFWAEWLESHAAFPQGLDIFFTCGDELLGLPRTTRIGRLQGV